jgi:hypothetical protein
MKTCIDCKQEKETCDFVKVKSYKGKDYYTKFCRKCNYQRRKSKGSFTPYTNAYREKWNAYQREYKKKVYWSDKTKEQYEMWIAYRDLRSQNKK